jgi:quinol monooxygenase YgiN
MVADMSGRRRRDNDWDGRAERAGREGRAGREENRRDRQDTDRRNTGRDPWSVSDGWPERGRPPGREQAALPPASGGAHEAPGGGFTAAGGAYGASGDGFTAPGGAYEAPGSQWPAGGDWPAAGGYQTTDRQAGYHGTGEAGQSGRGPWHDDQAFGAGTGAGAGQGFANPAYQEPGYAGNGYGSNGYASNGYGSVGYTGAGYTGSGYPATGNAGSGYAGGARDATQYGDQASAGYGHVDPGYRDAGYGGADWPGGGYSGSGNGQPARSGSGFGDGAGYGAPANGRHSGSYPADATSSWRPGNEFQESPATAQYGRIPAPQGLELTMAEYDPSGQRASENGAASRTPRPYGRLSIFTLLEDKAAEFDRLAERAAEGVRTAEPDTLVYVIHVVPKAPMQRIIYEIYRDREAFDSHERQPHIQRFAADRKACVLATNIIDLRLKYAKVASLAGPATAPAAPAAAAAALPPASDQETWVAQAPQSVQPTREAEAPRALDPGWPTEADGRYAGADYGRLQERDNRAPRARSRDWDPPSYQGQRAGGTR